MRDGSDENSSMLTLLQYFDSAFPIGLYAHSLGLESYLTSHGKPNQEIPALWEYVHHYLWTTLSHSDLALLFRAHSACETTEPIELLRLTSLANVSRSSKVARKTSQALGAQSGRVALALWPSATLQNYLEGCKEQFIQPEYAVITAILANHHRWGLHRTGHALAASTVRTLVTNAQRIIPLGQLRAQELISSFTQTIPEILQYAQNIQDDDLLLSDIVVDHAAMGHETLKTRIFLS